MENRINFHQHKLLVVIISVMVIKRMGLLVKLSKIVALGKIIIVSIRRMLFMCRNLNKELILKQAQHIHIIAQQTHTCYLQ